MAKYSIILENKVTVSEAYSEIIDGNLKIINTKLNMQFAWYPSYDNHDLMEIIEYRANDEINSEIMEVPNFTDFVNHYGVEDWYEGYIND